MSMIAALWMTAATGTAGAACPAEQAVYTMAEAPGFELSFPRVGHAPAVASDLYARLRIPVIEGRPTQSLWFVFTVSNGYQSIRLAPVTDPVAAGEDAPVYLELDPDIEDATSPLTRFLALDDALTVAEMPPATGSVAPAYILLPDIGTALWYNGGAFGLSRADGGSERISLPTAMFRRTGCTSSGDQGHAPEGKVSARAGDR